MDGFMRVYATRRNGYENQRVRTRYGRPICGRTGHTREGCYSQSAQRNSPSQQRDRQISAPYQHNSSIAVITPEGTGDAIVAQCSHCSSTMPTASQPAPSAQPSHEHRL